MHTVYTNEDSGTFILCEGCWRDLSTSEKINFYRIAHEKWWSDSENWEEIVKAIRYPYWWRNKSGYYLTFEEC
jgi:hypothetical protein